MTRCVQLVGRDRGQIKEVPYHVAQSNVASMGGNGNMCLPGEEADVRIRGLTLEVTDDNKPKAPVSKAADRRTATATSLKPVDASDRESGTSSAAKPAKKSAKKS